MQPQSTRQLLEIVEVVADGSLGSQPARLGHTRRRIEFDLDQLGRTGHRFDSISSIREEFQILHDLVEPFLTGP